MTIRKVLIIGNGAMAQHIGLQCALFDNEVVIYIRNPKKNDGVKASLRKVADSLVADNLVSGEKADQALTRITYSNSVEDACKDVDLVSESVAENPEAKIDVWKKFAPYLPASAILTTNTSSMLPSMFAEASGAPERFLAWHFHLTVFRQNLADIMAHPGTDPKYVEAMKDFTKSIQQNYCMMKKESPGYLANSMLFVVLDKALDLYLSGAADFI
ncbi:MAG: 3-hydroxyacyl-CoA dehydrogenase NAD-binding domain-containing protein, partial [Clostridiales bacterium]